MIAQQLQLADDAGFSTMWVGARTVLTSAMVNRQTSDADVDRAIDAVACAAGRQTGS